ncbi:MAG: primosomal protein N' (replication factor Y) (superfamily II helicase) [Parcubacteria bacterium C7867-006]|nr:MAG: primosomal protein N' (replication factor Y) (superfamily II helicase) [Parcubacteria bacterium C7867-006]
MNILTVIPIGRGMPKDSLTYFTKSEVPIGSIVSIPLRKKTIYGLVTGNRVAQEIKSELKSLSYSIKKIDAIETVSFLSDEFIKACQKIADYNAGSVGSVLSALIPTNILENSSKLTIENKTELKNSFYETGLLQSNDEERYATYKSLIREEFAKSRSVFFCLPTTEDLLNAKISLEKGIEKYTYILHSGIAKKELVSFWEKIVKEDHPVLIIATGSFLSLPRKDLGTIIIEKESSRAYKMQTRPYLDIRDVAEALAKELGIRLVLGDVLLRIETLWEEKKGKYAELAPLKFRSLTTANCELASMRVPADMKKKEFSILSDRLKELIKNTFENNENSFLFCARKGLYPITVCTDCGTVVVCKNCGAPTVLYARKNTKGESRNLFVCNHCGERDDAQKLCINCGGWRLNPLGIGIDRVAQEISTMFPNIKIFIMDKDHISTHKQAVKIRDLFYETPGSIMIGTEMALTYLNQKIENSAVVSLDSYFSIPDFQINEKIFHILLALRAISEKNFIIQTRQEKTKIFDYALRGNLMDFYRDEIEDRKSIGYPPFTTYIKVTIEGEKNTVKKEMEEIVEFMKPFELQSFEAFNPGSQKKYSIHGLISLQKGKWPNDELLQKLRIIQPHCTVRIDPATLL